MHNHVNTKGITVSNELKKPYLLPEIDLRAIEANNELNMIKEAANNTLLEFLSGLPYVVADLVIVRKEGAGFVVEADPYNWVGVAATPLDDELDLLGQMCETYEEIVGSLDRLTNGKLTHISAATQAIEVYELRNHLNKLDVEWRPSGRLGTTISSLSFFLADFEIVSNEYDEVSARTPVGLYVFTPSGDNEEVTLDLWL